MKDKIARTSDIEDVKTPFSHARLAEVFPIRDERAGRGVASRRADLDEVGRQEERREEGQDVDGGGPL